MNDRSRPLFEPTINLINANLELDHEREATGVFVSADWQKIDDFIVIKGVDGSEPYCIPLAECQTSAQVLDWIMQIAKKKWADDRILARFVRAIDFYVNPQATLCSMGVEKGKPCR